MSRACLYMIGKEKFRTMMEYVQQVSAHGQRWEASWRVSSLGWCLLGHYHHHLYHSWMSGPHQAASHDCVGPGHLPHIHMDHPQMVVVHVISIR